MSLLKKIGLFLSSFAPLFVLIIIKEIIEIINGNWTANALNISLSLILFLFLIYGILTFYSVYFEINKLDGSKIKIVKKNNITDQHFLGYFSIFVLFALSFEIEMYSMAFIFFVVLLLIGVVYIRNDMYYINPLINILGYSFYDIEFIDQNGNHYNKRAFFKGALKCKEYVMKDSYSNFIFIKCDNLFVKNKKIS